ncbi:MAG TPA: hypothetical protein VIH08_02620, partial [Blastococcus sp.]
MNDLRFVGGREGLVVAYGAAELGQPGEPPTDRARGGRSHRPEVRPAPDTFADAVDEGPSVVVGLPAEGL